MIQIQQADGAFQTLFLRVKSRLTKTSDVSNESLTKSPHIEFGRKMMSSELVSMILIRKNVPELVPDPTAWGTYTVDHDINFYLCSFHNMIGEVSKIVLLAAKIAELHKIGLSHRMENMGFQCRLTNASGLSL